VYAFGQFRNFWSGDVSASYSAGVLDDRLTRGGPLARKPPAWQTSAELYTDDRRQMSAYAYVSVGGDSAGGRAFSILPLITLRRGPALWLSLGPGYSVSRTAAQYVGRFRDSTATATLGNRYVFAALEQHSLDVTLRVNATFSPALSFQLYAQPFSFTAGYHGFKELSARRTFAFTTYGRDNGSTLRDTAIVSGADTVPGYAVDPDGPGPAASFTFKNPDFRTRSLQFNAVLRWEFRPGSTLFVVWTERRSGFFPFDDRFDAGRDLGRDLLRDRPTNVLLVKLNYWISL